MGLPQQNCDREIQKGAIVSNVPKKAARELSRFPVLKSVLKTLYGYLTYILFFRGKRYVGTGRIALATHEFSMSSFFGYYDKSPVNSTGSAILYHTTSEDTSRIPSRNKSVIVRAEDTATGSVLWQGESLAYTWQQGSRLQWLNATEFIYNDFDETLAQYVARRVRLTDGSVTTYSMPVYDCFGSSFALTMSFQRLWTADPGYGYRPIARDDQADGIYTLDLSTHDGFQLYSMNKIEQSLSEPSRSDACINHIMISPDGERFCFIHRSGRAARRKSQLLVGKVSGDGVSLLVDEGMVSHYAWVDRQRIIAFMRHNGIDGYFVVDVMSGSVSAVSAKLENGHGDGHPTVCQEVVVVDSYPDRSRMQHLRLFDISKSRTISSCSLFQHPRFFGVSRCDLHPRFGTAVNEVFVDSVYRGKRRLYKVQL